MLETTLPPQARTPPPSPVLVADTSSPLVLQSLPSEHGRVIDEGLALYSLQQQQHPSAHAGSQPRSSSRVATNATSTCNPRRDRPLHTWKYPRHSPHAFNHDSASSSNKWCVFAALIAGLFQQCLSLGLIMTYGTIMSYYTTHSKPAAASTKLSIVGAIPPFLLFSLASPISHLLDLGAHRPLNICGALLIPLSLLSLSFSGGEPFGDVGEKYHAILLSAIPLGLGQSIFFISSSHMARTWLPKRTGIALGVVNAGAPIGGSVFPLLFNHLAQHYSFRIAMSSLAATAAGLSAFILAFGAPHPNSFRPVASTTSSKSIASNVYHIFMFLRKPMLFIYVLSLVAMYAGVLSIPFHLQTWSEKLAFKLPLSPPLLTLFNVSQLPGRVLAPILSDYVRSRYIHTASLLLAAIFIPPLWMGLLPPTPSMRDPRMITAAAYIFAVVYGILHGALVGLTACDAGELLDALVPFPHQGADAQCHVSSCGATRQDCFGSACDRAGVDVELRAHSSNTITTATTLSTSTTLPHRPTEITYASLSALLYTLSAPSFLAGPLIAGHLLDTGGPPNIDHLNPARGIRNVGIFASACFALAGTLMGASILARAVQRNH